MALFDFLFRRADHQVVRGVPMIEQRSDSIVNLLTGLGHEQTDRGSSARPVSRDSLSDDNLHTLVMQHAVARRIVWLPARDSLRQGFTVVAQGTKKELIEDEIKTLRFRSILLEGIARARWYGGCVVLLVTDDVGSASMTAAPMREGSAIRNMVVLGKKEASALRWTTDLSDPNFGCPEVWQVSPTGSSRHFDVHHSRVMYFPGDPVDPEEHRAGHGYHSSVLESCWDQVRRHDQIGSAGALIAQDLRQASIKIEGLAKLSTEDQAELLKLRMMTLNRSRGMIGVMLMDSQDEYASHDQGVNGYGELHDRSQFDLAAGSGIPQTILFGQAPSGLTTDDESARRNYQGLCTDLRQDKANPQIVRFTSLVTGIPESDIVVQWPSLDVPNAKDKAEIEKLHAETDQIRIDSQVVAVSHVTRSRFGPHGYGESLDPVDEADIIDVKPGELPTPEETLTMLAGGGGRDGRGSAGR